MTRILAIVLAMAASFSQAAIGCTSALVPASKSATGRPLMWKHRDTGTEGNFIEKVAPSPSTFGYVALFNEGDSLLQEAWMGYNDAGFAIMNTASYNVAQYQGPEDREGFVMTQALKYCSTVDDFEQLLDTIAAPAGIMANFGVMDATGAMAYIEADDLTRHRYDAGDSVLVRTNFSEGWNIKGGRGIERFNATYCLLGTDFKRGSLTPLHFINKASHSFFDSSAGVDYALSDSALVEDTGKLIPRGISTASVVIEGAPRAADIVMWTVLGFPPLGYMEPVTLADIPHSLRPVLPGYAAPMSRAVNLEKRQCMTRTRAGKRAFVMAKLLPRMTATSTYNEMIYRAFHPKPQKHSR